LGGLRAPNPHHFLGPFVVFVLGCGTQHQHRGPGRGRLGASWGGGSGGSRDNDPVNAYPVIGVGGGVNGGCRNNDPVNAHPVIGVNGGNARPAQLPLSLKAVGYAYVLGVELQGEKKLLECRHHLSCRQKIMIISIKTAFYRFFLFTCCFVKNKLTVIF